MIPDVTSGEYAVDPARVGLAAYRLLTHVLASKPLAVLCTGHFACGYDILRDNFEEREVHHLLLELAISFRVNDDRQRETASKSTPTKVFVGRLWEPTESAERPLALREACNKIIHAKQIEPDYQEGSQVDERSLGRRVTLRGHREGHDWRAIVDIVELCEALAFLPT